MTVMMMLKSQKMMAASQSARSRYKRRPRSALQEEEKKKAKGKSGGATPGTPAAGQKDEPMDEIDAALKQLSAPGKSSGHTTAGMNDAVNESPKLLSIDTHHLHAQNEMRRLFERAALEQGRRRRRAGRTR